MKHFLCIFGFIGACILGNAAQAVSAGTVSAGDAGRGIQLTTTTTPGGQARGKAGLATTYKTNQRNTYFMVTQPDVDTACRQKIYACLSDYCGDVTVVPGQRESKCKYATESELYNYALLCLQKDLEPLLPQYDVNTANGMGGMNTAARLCPSYVQQELMSYLSMANMATQLSKSNSDLCLQRRQELEAAMSCHSVALTYGNETNSKLVTMLTDYCGSGIPGGSAEMVTRFSTAGNIGADIWGWAEKIVSLDLNKKAGDWQAAVDAVLAGYANRMNLACGDNMQINTVQRVTSNSSNAPTAIQTIAALAVGGQIAQNTQPVIENPYENQPLWYEVQSASEIYDYNTAKQTVMAGLSNYAYTQNAFLTSAQMDNIKTAYARGTKVIVLRDSTRCFVVPISQPNAQEQTAIAQSLSTCIYK